VKPCLSQVTTLRASFADDIVNAAAAGCPAVEVWLTKLEQHLETVSAGDTAKVVSDHGVTLAAAAYQGGLLLSQGEQRRTHFDHFKRRLDLCQRFGIPTLILVADFAQPPDGIALGRTLVSLAEAARWGAGFGVRLALEFRGTDAFCNCLDTAITLIEQAREPNLGVCLDLFHYYKGPSKLEDLDRLTASNLAHVQVCDVAGVPRELMTDADRVIPGDGDFHIQPLLQRLRDIGYEGYNSLELMNPTLWEVNAAQLAEAGARAMGRVIETRGS
jgi:sugar phosphate isomerase/epimerase